MKNNKLSGIIVCLCFLFFGNVWPDADSASASGVSSGETEAPRDSVNTGKNNNKDDIVFKPIGYGSLEIGQIASGYFRYKGQDMTPISHVWLQRTFGIFGCSALIQNRLEINISGLGLIAYSTPQIGSDPQTMQPRNIFTVKTAYAAYPFGGPENMSFKAQIGYFPFKYNSNVRNLGEYLFRSNAYPLLTYSDFDYPQADILGARMNFQFKTPDEMLHLQNDLLIHSELYSLPVQSWSLSDVINTKLFNAFTVGVGVSFVNLFSVYQGQYGKEWTDTYYSNPITLRNGGDTAIYEWKSTKVMAQLSFDPKKFMHTDDIFGKNDLILYSEADIIGLKDYPQFDNMANRTLYMVGLNFPGFKVMDAINAEIEYCPDTSAFSDENLYTLGLGQPSVYQSLLTKSGFSTSPIVTQRNPLRFSVYIKKSFFNNRVSFIAQCARDHKKINFYYFLPAKMTFMETLPSTSNWWWAFKTEFHF